MIRKFGSIWIFHLVLAAGLGASLLSAQAPSRKSPAPPKRKIDYNRDVRPILAQHCWTCHGPDQEANKKAKGLRLDSFAGATKDRGGYRAIAPGKPDESIALARAGSTISEMQMPPAGSGVKPLSKAQLDILRQWISEGAEYRAHWAFLPPKSPPAPPVRNKAWIRNGIDPFVLAQLEANGLKPEPEAGRAAWIRRVALTLTGLPPTPEEVDRYLMDLKPGSYERMVDRYLASPRYGEHQARYWLDAVRYGDTHGLHLDNERAIYPYRDWVVRAFNQDLPFDQFTLWQMAGDLLPNPTTEMRIATGYIRMNVTTNEGGAIEEEFLVKNTFDRVDTTSTVYLGMTVGCAKCHDHKYDPISQKDYYRLFAYFNSTKDSPFDGNLLLHEPVMKAPSPEEEAKIAAMRADLARLESRVDLAAAKSWIGSARVPMPVVGPWEVSQAFPSTSFDAAYVTDFGPEKPGDATATWSPIKIEIDKPIQFINRENASGYVRTTITSDLESDYTLRLSSDDGIRVWVNGKLVHDNKVLRGVNQSVDSVPVRLKKGPNTFLAKVTNGGGPDGFFFSIGDAMSERIDRAFRTINDPASEPELRRIYLEIGPRTEAAKAYVAKLAELRDFEAGIPATLVAEELPKPRPSYLLKRGEYHLRQGEVPRELPGIFGKLPAGAPNNRLGLAQWLVDKKNPLVSRVFVNRIWQQHFGIGIVRTAEDFGNQGEWPSHPELLDHLAVEFIANGWSIKKLHRYILNSASFRQSATTSELKLRKDPENRLISRGPRFRLDAEVLRDQALYVSGLLVEKPGGKGFKPYQPAGLWEAVGFLESTTSRYTKDMGDAIYRRTLYLFWKRTSPHPVMLTFDAPMREMCSVRRPRTNTPLQALVTMNEPAFLEAARVFAERLLARPGSDGQRLEAAFRIALGRRPKPMEHAMLLQALDRYRIRFASSASDADGLLQVGDRPMDANLNKVDVAAWTLVTSTLFNTDEFLTQH